MSTHFTVYFKASNSPCCSYLLWILHDLCWLRVVWFAGLVGACGISVLSALLRVHIFLEEKWGFFSPHQPDWIQLNTTMIQMCVWSYPQQSRESWRGQTSSEDISENSSSGPRWCLSVCVRGCCAGCGGVPCGFSGGAGVLSESRVWSGYSWTGKRSFTLH